MKRAWSMALPIAAMSSPIVACVGPKPPTMTLAIPEAPSASRSQSADPADARPPRGVAFVAVDIDDRVDSLAAELVRQREAASEAHQTLLVMTTQTPCQPCSAFDASLGDPRVRRALEGVRLVRVSVTVFREGLTAVRIPSDRVPGFALMGRDGRAKDCIDGGEWNEDVPENIATVIGAFVRGTYAKRMRATGCKDQPERDLP